MQNPTALEWVEGPHACSPTELAPALDVGTTVMRVERGMAPTWGHSWPHVYCPSNLENIRVIRVNQQVVSSMAIFPTSVRARTAQGREITLQVGGINGVATLPAYRRRGFAGLLLQDCHAKMRADGCDIGLLSTGIDNWYRRFGWENGGQQWTFAVDRGSVGCLPPLQADVHWQEVGPDRELLAQLEGWHNHDPLGARRPADLTQLLLFRPGRRLYVATRDQQLLAYLAIRENQIAEHGGQPEVAAGLIRALFAYLDDPDRSTSGRDDSDTPWTVRMTVQTPPVAAGLGHLLQELGLPHTRSYLGMIRILNAGQLLAKVAPQLEVVEETELGPVLQAGPVRHQLSWHELVKWIFGPERTMAVTAADLPLTFYQWPLDWV